jgi:hypothetical protein
MPEEILKIKKDSNYYVQNKLVLTHDIKDLNEYLTQLLGLYTSLEEEITLSELVHALYGLRKFISDYFSEDYEVLRAFVTGTKLEEPCKYVRFYKSFRVEADNFSDEEEYVYILPEVEFVKAEEGETGYTKLGEVPVIIDENLTFKNEEFSFNKKVKFTFQDIIYCIFDEVSEYVKEGTNISY